MREVLKIHQQRLRRAREAMAPELEREMERVRAIRAQLAENRRLRGGRVPPAFADGTQLGAWYAYRRRLEREFRTLQEEESRVLARIDKIWADMAGQFRWELMVDQTLSELERAERRQWERHLRREWEEMVAQLAIRDGEG